MLASWAPSTAKSYESAAKRWLAYTTTRDIHPLLPTANQCIQFLSEYYDTGVGHSAINTSRSFLSCFIDIAGVPAGEVPTIARYVKGTRRQRPPGTKETYVWDPIPVLRYIQDWGPIAGLTPEQMLRRTLVLFLLATGQRLQALHLMKRIDCQWEEDSLKIKYSERLKTNDPKSNPLILMFYKHEIEELCVFTHIKSYLAVAGNTSAAPYVFATVKAPARRATQATIARHVKKTLHLAGVGGNFNAYSARHASTSAAARSRVPVDSILKSAGWSRETTFSRFYKRPLRVTPILEETNFIPNILGD